MGHTVDEGTPLRHPPHPQIFLSQRIESRWVDIHAQLFYYAGQSNIGGDEYESGNGAICCVWESGLQTVNVL